MNGQTKDIYEFGPFRFDVEERVLLRDDKPVSLPPKVAETLSLLLQNAGHLVDKDKIIKAVWPDAFVEEGNLNKNIFILRKTLGQWDGGREYIETVPKRGYRFAAVVTQKGVEDGASGIPQSPVLGKAAPQVKLRQWFAIGILILLGLALVSFWQLRRRHGEDSTLSEAPVIRSLAVLPMENLSGDPSQDSFADAVTDQIITHLGRFADLRVISRTSVMQYKRIRKPLPQIAHELTVDAVVEGAVIRSNDEVRITAQLIYGPTDRHLWADSYTSNVRNVLTLQERVAADIAAKVLNNLNTAKQRNLATTRSVDPSAFEEYLRGISQSFTTDGRLNSIRYFNAAIEKQPNFAEAYVELAFSYMELGHMLALPPQESFPKAKAAALKAIALDEHLGGAHSMLGEMYLLYDWDFEAAEQEVRRAIELNPNRISNYTDYAEVLLVRGRHDEAMQQIRRKEEIDPVDAKKSHSRAAMLYYGRHYDEAIRSARSALVANPNSFSAHLFLGLALEQKRQFGGALAEFRKAVELSNENQWLGFIAHDLARSGDEAGARKILRQFTEASKRTYVSPWWMAIINSGLRDKEQTLYWLERAYEGREHDLVFSNCWPMFDFLRDDVRFKDLLHRIGLPQVKN